MALPTNFTDGTVMQAVHAAAHNATNQAINNLKIYNVLDYGAVGDGSTNDATAINNAIIAANAAGGGRVKLPAANYATTAVITLLSNVTLIGDGPGLTVVKSSVGSSAWVIDTGSTGQTHNLRTNVYVKEMTVALQTPSQGVRISNTAGAGYDNVELYMTDFTNTRESLVLQHCDNVIFYDTFIHDCTGDGVQLNDCTYGHVRGNKVQNRYLSVGGAHEMDDMIDIDEDFLDTHTLGCSYILVEDNITDGGKNGNNVRIASSSYIYFINNQALNHNCDAAAAILVNSYSGTGHPDTHDIYVEGNLAFNAKNAGLKAADGGGGLIYDIYFKGNKLKNCGPNAGAGQVSAGIFISADGIECTDNIIDGCGKNNGDSGGIVVFKKNSPVLRRNEIKNSPGAAVRFWNGDALQSYTGVVMSDTSLSSNNSNYQNLSVVTFVEARRNDALNPDVGYAIGSVTGAVTVNVVNGNFQTLTQTGNVTFTFTGGNVIGDTLVLEVVTGGFTQTWPSNFKKAGGSLAMSGTSTVLARWDGTNWVEVSRSISVS